MSPSSLQSTLSSPIEHIVGDVLHDGHGEAEGGPAQRPVDLLAVAEHALRVLGPREARLRGQEAAGCCS